MIQDVVTEFKSICLFYFHVASNIGDLAINEGVIKIVKKKYPNSSLKILILDGELSPHLKKSIPKNIDNYHFINARKKDVVLASILFDEIDYYIENSDLVIINSGEHYFQYLHGENEYSLFWRLIPALAAVKKNIPVVFFPSTVGPLETQLSKKLFEKFILCCTQAYIRDMYSLEYVRDNFPVSVISEVNLAPDPAFFLELEERDQEKLGFPINNTIALVMRLEDWGIRIKDSERKEKNKQHINQDFVNSVSYNFSCSFIEDVLNNSNKNIVLITQTLADKKMNIVLKNKYASTKRVFHNEPIDVQDYLNKLSFVDCVVSSRFHALIMGLVVGKKGYGVYFDNHGYKMPGLFSMLEIKKFCHLLNSENFELISDSIVQSILESEKYPIAKILSKIALIKNKFIVDVFNFKNDLNASNGYVEDFQSVLVDLACNIITKNNGEKLWVKRRVKNSSEDDPLKLKIKLYSLIEQYVEMSKNLNSNNKSEKMVLQKNIMPKKINFMSDADIENMQGSLNLDFNLSKEEG